MNVVRFNVESLDTIEAEVRAFTGQYLKEFPSPFETFVNWDTYYALQDVGVLKVVTARDDELLVGFCVFTVAPHQNTQNVLVAQELALFLLPAYRKGRLGLRLLDFIEQAAKDAGAKFMTMSDRGGNLAKLLTYRGYAPVETVHAKEL